MFEPKEVVNMIATLGFFIYFYYLVRKGNNPIIPKMWLYGVLLITISSIATVLEGFILPTALNFIEHLSFTIACLFFLLGALFIKETNAT